MDHARSRTWTVCILAVLISLAGAAGAFAQGQGNGTLTGIVIDNAGVVPGVTITVTNASAGLVRSAVTNAQGEFRLVALPGAKYAVKVEMAGFKQIATEVTLLAGETRDLGKMTLVIGGRTEEVTVTSEATPVQTSSSSLQKNLSGDLLTSVQVKGRDIFGMLKLLPGVIDSSAGRDFAQWNSGRSLSINGGNSLNKNTTIDGVPVGEEGGNGTTHITPNIDAVSEVNVISSGYTAENGRMASGQVAMTTKSGTNQFKGSGWYNYRRDWMNMNDYFRIKQGNAKPFFAVNISGYSVGGPVIIPKVLNSRVNQKKVFFFASQEFTNDIRPTAVSYTNLPTKLERAGDFSQTFFGNATGTADGTFISGTRTVNTLANPFAANGVTDFFCAVGTGGLSGTPCAGTTTVTNIINAKYFNPMGRSMLALMPQPNNKYNPAPNQFNTANDARDTLPIHKRKNIVIRIDTVLTQKTRFSVRALFDRDDSTTFNRVAPGIGSVDNAFPGNLMTATLSQVLRPTVVNEFTVGLSQNHYGFQDHQGALVATDYTQWYRQNIVYLDPATGAQVTGLDPPRLAAFGPYGEPRMGRSQADQYPYFPDMSFNGGSRSGYTQFRPSGGSAPLPRRNENIRYTFADDLTMVKGHHSFKFGTSGEMNSKTEPGSSGYSGSYSFGHSTDNPLSTGNGYANALIGVFTSYSELDKRVDYDIHHWLVEGYAQDTWRVTPRFTLDYGVRLTHNGSLYDVRDFNSAFDPALFQTSQIPALFRPFCRSLVAGNVACSSANRAAINPLTNEVVSQAFAGTLVPGSGNVANGQFVNGENGKPHGVYDQLTPVSMGPRGGFAWDVSGNGKMAIRGSAGMFYNLFNRGNYGFTGGPLISISRQVLNAQIGDIATFRQTGNLAVSPQNTKVPQDFTVPLYGKDLERTPLQAEKHYQANFAVQRDLGFSTVAEVAYVGNFGRHYFQTKTANNIPVNAYANPANLFNNEAIAANFIRRDYLGIGALNYGTTNEIGLNYNSLQVSVQRRLSHGLQMGASYSLAKGEGMRGWDYMTEELYGAAGLKARYYGPQTASDQGLERRHSAVFHYSYAIPTLNLPVLKYILAGWEAAGVTTIVTGDPINPVCNQSGLSGIANNDPSLSGVTSTNGNNLRCEWVVGQSLFSGYDPSQGATGVLKEDQIHFNTAAFQRPLPLNTAFSTTGTLGPGAAGNLGNVPWGVLRNPGWSNWDFTLSRRIPVKVGSRKGNMRIQLQMYNLFNQVEFNAMGSTFTFTGVNATGGLGGGNTNTQTGKYTGTQPPFNGSITVRFDY